LQLSPLETTLNPSGFTTFDNPMFEKEPAWCDLEPNGAKHDPGDAATTGRTTPSAEWI
jgi:hypothetical protein